MLRPGPRPCPGVWAEDVRRSVPRLQVGLRRFPGCSSLGLGRVASDWVCISLVTGQIERVDTYLCPRPWTTTRSLAGTAIGHFKI